MIVLDTDHMVWLLQGDLQVAAQLRSCVVPVGVSVISVAELMCGAAKSAQPTENQRRVEIAISDFQISGIDLAVCRRFGQLKADLERSGHRFADADLLIGVTCLTQDATLATHNRAHFERIPGLSMVDWHLGSQSLEGRE